MFDKEKYSGTITERQLKELFEEAVKQGAVEALLFFDSHGHTEEEARNSLVDLVSRISKEKGVLYCKAEIEKPLEKDGVFSTYGETRILTDSYKTLINVALKYGPVVTDLLQPTEIKLTHGDAQALLLDVSQASQDFTTYILQHVLTGEEKQRMEEQRKRRSDLGAQLQQKTGNA